MADHTKDVVANIIAETNIGGGQAGAAYAKTALGDDVGVPMQAPYQGAGIDMLIKEINREFVGQIGTSLGEKQVVDNGIITTEKVWAQFLQDDRWPDAIVNTLAAAGLPSQTFASHWENIGNHKEDVFGIYPIIWNLELAPRTFPKQITTVRFFDSAISSQVYTTDKGFSTTKPIVNNDITISIAELGDLKWRKARFHLGVFRNDDPEIVEEAVKYPLAEDLDIQVDLTFMDFHASLLDITDAIASVTDHDVVLTMGAIDNETLTLNDLIVKPESSNIQVYPEKGLFMYEMSLVPGPNFAFATDITLDT